MFTLRKTASVGLGALGLALTATTAMAGTLGTTPVTYSTEAVTAAAGAITLPATSGIVYTTNLDTATTSSGSFTVVFTLPSGVTPSGAVTATTTDNDANKTCALVPNLAGTVSGQTITFVVPTLSGGTAGKACTVTLNAFNVTGATALGTATAAGGLPSAGFPIKASLTSSTNNGFNIDTTPQIADLAISASALAFTYVAGGPLTINVAGLFNGISAPYKVFSVAGGAVSTSGATVATLKVAGTTAGVKDAGGLTDFTLGSSATVTITGSLTGFSGFYLNPADASTCATTEAAEQLVASVVTASISGNTATLSSIPLSANTTSICGYAGGSAVLGANYKGLTVKTAVGAGSTSKLSGAITYNGGNPFFVSYTGNNGSYPTFLRIGNNTGASLRVICNVQADNGSEGAAYVENTLGAGKNDLVSVSTIMSNAGVTADSTGRASLYCASTAAGVSYEHLMLNPNGTVTQIGSDFNNTLTSN